MPIYTMHTVVKGDTLRKIAREYDTSVETLSAWNSIKNPNAIQLGQELRVRQVSESYYVVRKGDTLYRIAKTIGSTVSQLQAANNMHGATGISVGQELIIPASVKPKPPSPKNPSNELGSLSRKYEVSKDGPGTVSHGQGDHGGVSYGSYQFSSKQKNACVFLKDEGQKWEGEFQNFEEGSAEFSEVWRAIAAREPQGFHAAQHEHVKRKFFDRQVKEISKICGLDVTTRSRALQDAVWSTAVQHGATTSLIGDAIKDMTLKPADSGFDRQLLMAIYAERGKTREDGVLIRFRSSSAAFQRGVAKRFANELRDALEMLKAEEALKIITPLPDSDAETSRKLLKRAQKNLTDEDVYHLIEAYGDAEAGSEFLEGKKVVIALRNPTNSKKYLKGKYDDPMIVVWRLGDGSVRLKRFMGNTEPARIYAWGQKKASKGSSTDLNRDGRNDLGRLQPGTYHYSPRKPFNFLGNKAFRAREVQACMRDINHDGVFSEMGDQIDPTGAGRSMLLHQGGYGNSTWSAGCQTISRKYYNKFLAVMGKQTSFSYILINVR